MAGEMTEPTQTSRRVLVLSYRFPPQGGAGVQRIVTLVKYLGRHAWQPVVHTVRNPHWPVRDESLLREVPADVPVYRTPSIEFERIESALSALRPRRGDRASMSAGHERAAADAVDLDPHVLTERQKRLRGAGSLGRLRDAIWSRLLSPDPQIAWVPAALLRSLWIVRRRRVSAIYSNSPPNSVNVLALALKRLTGLPWVADLRDPWTDGLHRQQWYEGNPSRQAREERWERSIFERADHILVTSPRTLEGFLAKYPWCPAQKLTLVTNGFDPAAFSHTSARPRLLEPGLVHVTNVGNVEALFDAVPLFRAVHDLVSADREVRAGLRLNFVGTKRQPRYDEYIRAHGLGDVIRFHPYVPHADGLQYLAESHVLLMCQIPRPESGGVKLSAKMFEYFYLRKPVLALTIPGVTAEMLARSGLGMVVRPDDVDAIKALLSRLWGEVRGGGVQVAPDEEYIERFNRQEHARVIAGILDKVSAAAASSEAVPRRALAESRH
jgi:glycosyltransferase involved in cell wall biosynthesis